MLKVFAPLLALVACSLAIRVDAQDNGARFRVIALYENGGHHLAYSNAAVKWLDQLASDSNFTIEYIQSTENIDSSLLKQYQLFIQLDFPPYGWKPTAARAFEEYINQGHGGWLGFHHATLLGEFDGYPLWDWFWRFMGSIRFRDYIPGFADATVVVEQPSHPVFRNLPDSFTVSKEEWYTYDHSPRQQVQVQVLARVLEQTYHPDSKVKMGDHPVIWTNSAYKARNLYIFMGHSPLLFADKNYTDLLRNAIMWTAGKN